MPESTAIRQITDELSRIFRHMLPGLAVIGVAAVSHPSWFKVDPTLIVTGWHVAILAAVALTVGNAWYVVHRYTLHQLIDYVVYAIQKHTFRGYLHWLREHVDKSFHMPESEKQFREHVHFRSAQIIFMFIISEALIAFSITPEDRSYFARHVYLTRTAGIVLFFCAIVQYPISHSLDVLLDERPVQTKLENSVPR